MPMIDMEKTGENIKNFRKQKKVSVEEISTKIGVSERSVFKWQAGKSIPSIDNLVVMAAIFGTTIDNIIAVTV